MSIWKADKERRTESPAPNDADAPTTSADIVEITALEIAADPEVGCDPYNSTGQFLAEELKRYSE